MQLNETVARIKLYIGFGRRCNGNINPGAAEDPPSFTGLNINNYRITHLAQLIFDFGSVSQRSLDEHLITRAGIDFNIPIHAVYYNPGGTSHNEAILASFGRTQAAPCCRCKQDDDSHSSTNQRIQDKTRAMKNLKD
jgi:hypothetical protein